MNPWLILALLAAMTAGTVLSRWYFTPANHSSHRARKEDQ